MPLTGRLSTTIPVGGFFSFPFKLPAAGIDAQQERQILLDAEELRQLVTNNLQSDAFGIINESAKLNGVVVRDVAKRANGIFAEAGGFMDWMEQERVNGMLSTGQLQPPSLTLPESIDIPGQTFVVPPTSTTLPIPGPYVAQGQNVPLGGPITVVIPGRTITVPPFVQTVNPDGVITVPYQRFALFEQPLILPGGLGPVSVSGSITLIEIIIPQQRVTGGQVGGVSVYRGGVSVGGSLRVGDIDVRPNPVSIPFTFVVVPTVPIPSQGPQTVSTPPIDVVIPDTPVEIPLPQGVTIPGQTVPFPGPQTVTTPGRTQYTPEFSQRAPYQQPAPYEQQRRETQQRAEQERIQERLEISPRFSSRRGESRPGVVMPPGRYVQVDTVSGRSGNFRSRSGFVTRSNRVYFGPF